MKAYGNKISCGECPYTLMKNVFSGEDFELINCNKSEIKFAPNETILKQGTYISQIAYIKNGLVKIILESDEKRQTILNFVEGSNFIAIPVLGNNQVYPFSVIAITDCEICLVRVQSMLDVIDNNNKVNRYFLEWMANDYVEIYNKISTISTRNSHGKLASALMYLTNGRFKTDVLKYISRKELAQLASVSLESTNKILGQLKHDGIIDISNNYISILRPELIEKLSTIG